MDPAGVMRMSFHSNIWRVALLFGKYSVDFMCPHHNVCYCACKSCLQEIECAMQSDDVFPYLELWPAKAADKFHPATFVPFVLDELIATVFGDKRDSSGRGLLTLWDKMSFRDKHRRPRFVRAALRYFYELMKMERFSLKYIVTVSKSRIRDSLSSFDRMVWSRAESANANAESSDMMMKGLCLSETVA